MDAYVDESGRDNVAGRHSYVVVAVLLSCRAASRLVEAYGLLRPRGATRLHWRLDSTRTRRAHLDLISDLTMSERLFAVAAHATVGSPRQVERARVRCLAAVVADLNTTHATRRVVIESRDASQNRHDDRTLMLCRQNGAISPGLRWEHCSADDEPLLWCADAVAGVLSASLAVGDNEWLGRLPTDFVRIVWRGDL